MLPHYFARSNCSTTQLNSTVNSVQKDVKTFNYSKYAQGMPFLYLSTQINLPCV